MSAIHFADSFTGTGTLDGTDTTVGALAWSVIDGTVDRGTSGASGTGLAVVDAAWPNGTVTVTGGSVYARVVDKDNWWRARIVTQQVRTGTYTYFGPWSDFVWQNPPASYGLSSSSPAGDHYFSYQTTSRDGTGPTEDYNGPWAFTPPFKYRHRNVLDGQVYTTYYQLVVEKCVAGTVTAVATSDQTATVLTTPTLAVLDNTLTASAGSLSVSATDATFNAATKFGFSGSGATDWSLDLVGANQPPAIVSPVNNADVDITDAVVTIATGLPITDPQTAGDAQWRNAGASTWTVVTDAFGTGQTWQIPEADLTAGRQVEVQARVTDSNSNTSGWSGSGFLTPRAKPSAPSFVSPTAGSDVVASDIATVDFGTDSTARQARRVADDGSGGADESTVYQASLTITGPDDDGNYLLTGDGSIHPTGAEHIQARRQTAAGGTLWSDWADLAVTMALAAPFVPLVSWVGLPADAQIQFAFTCPAADVDHADTDHIDVYRGGVRVASVTVTDNAASWLDRIPGKASDYVFTAVAVNGATASWGEDD